MGLVILSAFFNAAIFALFKWFGKRGIALLPTIVVNYLTAFAVGMAVSRPWTMHLDLLWGPSMVEGAMFVALFRLMGLSTQWNGIAPTTVAGKMSLALTVLCTMLLFHERPGALACAGIALALPGVVLSSWGGPAQRGGRRWALPVIFIASAATDLLLATVERTRLTPLTEAAFPTLIFGFAAFFGLCWLAVRPERTALRSASTWAAGAVLGLFNYGSIHFLVIGLARSGLPASIIFPLANVCVIVFGAAASLLLFRERFKAVHWAGLVLSLAALSLIICSVP